MNDEAARAFAEIDAALRTWPVSHAPASLAPSIMARVRSLAAPKPRFSLAWLDFAFPLFATLMFAVAFALWFNLPTHQAAYLTAQLRWAWLLFVHQLGLHAFNASTVWVGTMAVAALFAVLLVLREPRFNLNR
ncbi:MAG: hypothetical protein ACT4QE_09595 [Anaerolineales bacterium]